MYDKQIKISEQVLKVEVADSIEARSKGLSGHKSLCQDCGMLFEFPDFNIRSFHMTDMKFPLDIIWLRKGEIVGIEKDVQIKTSDGEINRIQSKEPINMVLEVNAGWAEENRIKVGDVVFTLD